MKTAFILLFIILPLQSINAQGMSGNEFWFGFSENIAPAQIKIAITTTVATNGTVSAPLNGWTQNFSVSANSTLEISVPLNVAGAIGNMSLENKGIQLISNDPVNVSIYNGSLGSDDATSVLPVSNLGYDYMALTYLDPPNTNWGSPQILVVAIEDNTQININLTGALSNGQTGPLSINLNRGQTYQVQSYWFNQGQNNGNDLSGSLIESVCNSDGYKHKIAVFSGDLCSNVGGLQCGSCDHLFEQMWPLDQLGTDFVVPAPVNRETYKLKVVAKDNGTVVNISGQAAFNLNSGQWQQFDLTGDQTITTNLPVAIGQFTLGQDCSNTLGDPFFAQIIPNTQMQTEWNFFSYESGSNFNPFDNYINIVAPIGTTPILLNGNPISAALFQVVGGFRVAKIPFPANATTNSIISQDGFLAYVYGFGAARSYSYNSGISGNINEINFDISYLQNSTNQSIFDDTLCSCESVEFISTFEHSGYNIIWDFGDGQTGTGSPISHDYINGSYDVVMSIEDISGCKVDSVVHLNLVIINCDIEGPFVPICPGTSVQLSSVNNAFTYLWSTGETTQNITVSPLQTTEYWLQLDGGTIPICESITVAVYEDIPPLLNDAIICENETLELNIGTGFSDILWNTSETTPSIFVNLSGEYTVEATDINNCPFYDTSSVVTQTLPQWSITGDVLFCEGDSVLFQGPNFPLATYSWDTGANTQNIYVKESGTYQLIVDDGVCITVNILEANEIISMFNYYIRDTILCATNFELEIPDLPGTDYIWSTGDTDYFTTLNESGIYWVTIGNQCETWTDTVEVIIDCSSELFVPNAFTPDGDGLNDIFYAKGYGIQEFEMLIFNRWGELIFRSTDIEEGWDGIYRGIKCMIGVYSYKIITKSITNIKSEYIGHVSLVR